MRADEMLKIWEKYVLNYQMIEELPMKSPTEQIYYLTLKAESKVETVNLTINLKRKKFLENE
jgi:hypothetical protein